ncbi:tornado 1 [Actinidia rufa]|uniref:Tornado 1 n=1 Tax=Actinidia rufa TaxID=165716 RepID=A0A7J0G2L9_9ERIC|nr:tornado 1 [Actinidia rufa]
MLRRNRLSTECLSELSDILKRNRVVKEVMFSESSIGSVGAGLIASALKVNNCLEELQIWEDSIGSKGADELSKMIEVNPTLKLLTIFDSNSITETPLISGILAKNRTMKVHVWSGEHGNKSSKLKSRWAKEFRWVLEQNRSLKEVNLSKTCLKEKGVVYVAAGLFKNQCLDSLYLDANRFSGIGVEHLLCPLSSCLTDADDQSEHDTAIMETLQVNPWIEELDLARTPLQNSGKTEEIYQKLGQNDKTEPETDLLKGMSMVVPKSC